MKCNRAGIELIKSYEGFMARAYLDPVGKLTIGYGTTDNAGVGHIMFGQTVTEEQASEMLVASLPAYEAGVMRALKRVPNENQFSAMVSLCYNIGVGAFSTSSVARLFNAGNVMGAADAFRLWNKGTIANQKVVLPGLIKRREAERQLFLRPVSSDAADTKPPSTVKPVASKGIAAMILGLVLALIAGGVAWFTGK